MENLCKFEMDIADRVRTEINKLENPDDKYKMLNLLDNFLSKIRHEVSSEWTWCGICAEWVKVADRIVTEEDGYTVTRCGNCNAIHHRVIKLNK